jgi:dihydroorotase
LNLQDRGTFNSGARADVTIIDPEMTWTFEVSKSKSKSRNTPFNGYQFRGGVVATIVSGRVVHLRHDYERVLRDNQQTASSGVLQHP